MWETENKNLQLSDYHPVLAIVAVSTQHAKTVSDNTSSMFIFRQTGHVASEGGEALVDK